MQVSYKLAYSDYKAALKLHYSRKGRWTSPMNLFTFMPAIGSLLIICALIEYFHDKDSFIANNPPGLICIPLFFLSLPLIYAFALKKQFKGSFPHSRNDGQMTIDINDERIVTWMPGLSETKIFWQAIDRFAQNEKVTMFYTSEVKFIFFPTKSLSESQHNELNALVASHVVKR